MNAELVFVGTELLLGDILNTNAQFLSRELSLLGVDVYRQTTVGDNLERVKNAIREALSRSDIVITTGGLGPTEDDLTKEAVAEALGLPMELHANVLESLRCFFAERRHPMTKNNEKQAWFPKGSELLKNPRGTAPGCYIHHKEKHLFVLPGPPWEMEPMFRDEVRPILNRILPRAAVIVSRTLKMVGIGESVMEEKVKDLLASANPTVAPYAKYGEVTLRLTAKCGTMAEAERLIASLEKTIRERIGETYIYGADEDTLESVVGELLRRRGWRLATAESCTGGLLADQITNVAGSSDYFDGGFITYSNAAKSDLLGVDPVLIANKGAVSPEVAAAMAEGARRVRKADVGVGITGIAGPGGGTAQKPVGLVYMAVALPNGTFVEEHRLTGERAGIKRRSAKLALNLLRRKLLSEEL